MKLGFCNVLKISSYYQLLLSSMLSNWRAIFTSDQIPHWIFFPLSISQRRAPHLSAFLPLPLSCPITRAFKIHLIDIYKFTQPFVSYFILTKIWHELRTTVTLCWILFWKKENINIGLVRFLCIYVNNKIFYYIFKHPTSASWNVFIFSNLFDRPLTYLDFGCLIISPSPPSPSTFFSSFFRLSAPAHLVWERSSAVFTLKYFNASWWWFHPHMKSAIKVIRSAWYSRTTSQ